MKRAYGDYLRDMLDATPKAERFVADVTEEQFKANDEKVFAVVRALEIVGKAARAIPTMCASATRPSPGAKWPGCATSSSTLTLLLT